MADPFFKPFENPVRIHLLQGKRGLAGEIVDLRQDISGAFGRVADTVVNPSANKAIQIVAGYASSIYQSDTIIPEGSKILEVLTEVVTPYNGGATLSVILHGMSDLSLQLSSENNPSFRDTYSTEPLSIISAAQAGKVRVLIGGSPSEGESIITVSYVEHFLG